MGTPCVDRDHLKGLLLASGAPDLESAVHPDVLAPELVARHLASSCASLTDKLSGMT